MSELSSRLRAAGWEHTYDWTSHCASGKQPDTGMLCSISEEECEEVKQADAVVILSPQGRGMAVALNKRVYLCHGDGTYFRCDEQTGAFYWLPQVHRLIGDTGETADELLKLER